MGAIIGLLIIFIIILIFSFGFAISREVKKNHYLKTHEQEIRQEFIEIEKLIAQKKEELEKMISDADKDVAKQKKELNDYKNAIEKDMEFMKKIIATYQENYDIIEFGFYDFKYDFKSSEEYEKQLDYIRNKEREFVKLDKALNFPASMTLHGSVKEGEKMINNIKKLMLRAFNGECDGYMVKVKYNNVKSIEERIRKSAEIINKFGEKLYVSLTNEFVNLKINELNLIYEYQEKLEEEKEEIRAERERMKEEEKARKEFEKAEREAKEEEARYSKALEEAQKQLEQAKGAEFDRLQEKIRQLELQVQEAKEKERKISQAQMTKCGYVYVISNIGSFGENVYKIGMTRRLEPMDRVKELGDASVPFSFDVHAMIFSDNAPELENRLHKEFQKLRVNRINERKEFFKVDLKKIEEITKTNNGEIHFIDFAEAKEYRETLALIESEMN